MTNASATAITVHNAIGAVPGNLTADASGTISPGSSAAIAGAVIPIASTTIQTGTLLPSRGGAIVRPLRHSLREQPGVQRQQIRCSKGCHNAA